MRRYGSKISPPPNIALQRTCQNVTPLQTWIDGNIDYAGWDYFEACKIVNSELEKIRLEAIEATWLKSPYIEDCGGQNEHFNERGISEFKELKEKCLALV